MLKNKIIRDTILLTLMQLVLDSAGLFLNGFITRRLGASAVGIFTLMGSFLGFAGMLSNGNAFLCTSRLISEEIGKKQGDPNRILLHGLTLCMIQSIAVSVALLIFAEPVGMRFFGETAVISSLRLMPAALISGAAASCFKGYFNASRKASTAAAGDVLEFAVRSCIIVFLTMISEDHGQGTVCRIMIASIIAGNLTSLIFMGILYVHDHSPCNGRCSLTLKEYAAFAFPIMGGGILTTALSSTNDALVPYCLRQFGDSIDDALALFGIFEAIVIPAIFFPSVVLCSLSGMIITESARAAASGNTERIRSITSRLIRYTMIYSVFAAAVLIRFGMPIGRLLGGGEQGGAMISAIAPVVPFIYMEIVLEAMIKGMGLQSFSSLNYLAEYVIRISAVLILVPKTGFPGIAVSYYASNIFGNISRLVKLLRHTGVRFRPFSMVISPVVYSVMTMAAAELFCTFLQIKGEGIAAILTFVVIWGIFYAGIYALSFVLTPKNQKSDTSFVHCEQRIFPKVM